MKTENTFKNWMTKQYEHDEMADLANHGAKNGFPGMSYYSETAELYKEYHEDIWNMLNDDAEMMDQTPLELIAGFGDAASVGNAIQFENLLVWYAAEKISRDLTDDDDDETMRR
jgi:hypothetical protein